MADGTHVLPLATSQDHKRLLDGDCGPNTGGMGAYSPAPIVTPALQERIMREVIHPTIDGLRSDGTAYTGFLYAGLMIAADGTPNVLEYNCRFGDPETQPIMARAQGDLGAVLLAAAMGELQPGMLAWDARVAICVVVAAAGYPGNVQYGEPIAGPGLDRPAPDGVVVFHAGTALRGGHLVTAGGRVVGVTALGISVEQARERAYVVVDAIELSGKQARRDIGARH
jgi:phosphoribosylamine---glycine ligase